MQPSVVPAPAWLAHCRLRPAQAAAAPTPCATHAYRRAVSQVLPDLGTALATVCLFDGVDANARGAYCPRVAAHRACYRAGGAPALRDGGTVLLAAEPVSFRVIPHVLLHCSLGGGTRIRSVRGRGGGSTKVLALAGGSGCAPKSSTASCTRSMPTELARKASLRARCAPARRGHSARRPGAPATNGENRLWIDSTLSPGLTGILTGCAAVCAGEVRRHSTHTQP